MHLILTPTQIFRNFSFPLDRWLQIYNIVPIISTPIDSYPNPSLCLVQKTRALNTMKININSGTPIKEEVPRLIE